MPREIEPTRGRIERLERQLRVLQSVTAVAIVLIVWVAVMPRSLAQQSVDTIRVRQLVIEDGDGKSRVVLGYLDAPGNTSRIGIRINDPNGAERFGLSYRANGSMGMGFDAPPGTGDDANRERINLAADEKGGAYIRFLDRRTSVASRMYLDEQNRVWLSFSDFTQKPASIRRYGLTGEEMVRTRLYSDEAVTYLPYMSYERAAQTSRTRSLRDEEHDYHGGCGTARPTRDRAQPGSDSCALVALRRHGWCRSHQFNGRRHAGLCRGRYGRRHAPQVRLRSHDVSPTPN